MKDRRKITYEDFTERVAKRANVSEAEADAYIHQFSRTAGDALETGDDVQLYHFGRFSPVHVDERSGSNPNTGEALTVQEHTRVDFQPYKALLVAVNWPFRNLRTRMLPEEEAEKRSSVIPWLLLALALLALLLAGIGLYTWMSGTGEVNEVPTEVSADAPAATAPEEPAVEPAPEVASTESGTATDTDTATQPDTGTDTDTGAPAAAPTDSAATTTTMVVAPGDTLWDIAQSQWGDTSWWPVLYAENRATLTARNPDLIETGASLRIPGFEGSAAAPTQADLRDKADAYRIVANDYERLGHARAGEYRSFVNREFGGL